MSRVAAPVMDDVTLTDLLSLRGRHALVTGGCRGIGLACAVRLAEAGANVVVGDRDPDESLVEQALVRLGGRGGRVLTTRLDVTDPADVDAAIGWTLEQLGGLDILVNNAGIFPAASVLDQDFETWRQVLAVNLDGTLRCSRAAAAHMATAGGGVIVNVTSTNGHRGAGPGLSAYTSSKHALTGLTKALAIDLAPVGVRVLAVAPTTSDTPGFQEKVPELVAAGLGDVLGTIGASLPLGRIGRPDDAARAVLFAASDLAAFMTGSTLFVDGGGMAV